MIESPSNEKNTVKETRIGMSTTVDPTRKANILGEIVLLTQDIPQAITEGTATPLEENTTQITDYTL